MNRLKFRKSQTFCTLNNSILTNNSNEDNDEQNKLKQSLYLNLNLSSPVHQYHQPHFYPHCKTQRNFATNTNANTDTNIKTNTSLCLDTQLVFRELSQEQVMSKSSILTDRNAIASRVADVDIKATKKKMGIQLSILQKNILDKGNNTTKNKPKRLNRSGFIRKPEDRTHKLHLNSTLPTPHPHLLQKQTTTSSQPLTSSDLQLLHKLDKEFYRLYFDLYGHYKEELEKKKQYQKTIRELQTTIEREEREEIVLQDRVREMKGWRQEKQELGVRMESQIVGEIRRKLEMQG